VRRFFTSSAWQGISGVLAAVAIVEAVGFFFYGQHLQNVAATANLEVTTIYRYDGSNLWTMNLEVHNGGPAIAKDIHLVYSGVHTTCFLTKLIYDNGRLKKVSTVAIKSDLQCGGNALESVVPAKSLAGLNIHPLASFSASDAIKLFSGTAYNVYPDEDLWVDFHFKAASNLNRRLKAAMPHTTYNSSSLTKIVRPFFSQFSQVTVTGANVRVSPTTYSVMTLSR
jgi:hypothetical protein